MAYKLNEFLLNYYKQLNFNSMPVEIRAQFDTYASNSDFRGNMKDWNDNLIDNTTRENKELPTDADLEPGELEKLFTAFQNAFRSMDANKNDFKDNKKAGDFLKEYFTHTDDAGNVQNRLFSLFTAPAHVTTRIDELHKLLTQSAEKEYLYAWLQMNGVFENRTEFSDFLDAIKNKKYNSDIKVRDKLIRIASYLDQGDFSKKISLEREIGNLDLQSITSGFDDNGVLDPAKLDYFRRNYDTMLRALYKESKVREEFAKYDNGKISKSLNDALGKTDYLNKESKDFVPPKRDDQLTLGQKISKWKAETFEDYFEKYSALRGDRKFLTNEAKLITKAIDGVGKKPEEKIKPTDGLERVLAESAKIKENLQYKSPKAAEAFEYFEKIMGELKNTMPKAFAKALSNGTSLRAIVEEMIMHAVRNGKVNECKIAMEVLSVIKYGWTTSKVMNAIGKEKMTIFSDPGLTWNKTAGMKFVTTALDKSIKTAFMGVGYAITITGNAIRLSDNKFNGHTGRMAGKINEWDTDNNAGNTKNRSESANIAGQIDTIRNNVSRNGRIIESDVIASRDALKIDIDVLKQDLGILKNNNKNLNDEIATLGNNISGLEQEITELQNLKREIKAMDADIKSDRTALAGLTEPELGIAKAVIAAKEIELSKKQTEFTDKNRNSSQKINAWRNARQQKAAREQQLQTNHSDIDTKNREMSRKEGSFNLRENRLNEFKNANDNIAALTNQRTKLDNEYAEWDDKHKDQYKELMAHWDFLETGSNTKSFMIGSRKAKQKAFDEKIDVIDHTTGLPLRDAAGNIIKKPRKEIMLAQHLNQYEYAA